MKKVSIDLSGQAFGNLTVLEEAPRQGKYLRRWRCLCSCGRETTALQSNLRSGYTQSCGCAANRYATEHWKAGDRFGRLLLLKRLSPSESGRCREYWNCTCDCGVTKTIQSYHLSKGLIRSCGCLQREIRYTTHLKHGDTRTGKRTPEYRTWLHIKNRCTNPKNKKWWDYGGRGITVCQRWMNSFEEFLADVGRRPGPDYSIDRIDNDLGYSVGNVRWATPIQQQNNKRYNHVVRHEGKSQTLAQWEREKGLRPHTICQRAERGWTSEMAINTPHDRRLKTFQGKSMTLAQWSVEISVPVDTLYHRLKAGWSLERTLSTPRRAKRATY